MHREQIIASADIISGKLDMIAVNIAKMTTIVGQMHVTLHKVKTVLGTHSMVLK